MDDSRLQFGGPSFNILLVVRYISIQKRPIFGSLTDTTFRFGLARSYIKKVYGFRSLWTVVVLHFVAAVQEHDTFKTLLK